MYSRKRRKGFLNEIWWDNEYNKNLYSYIVLAVCIVILLVIGGFKLNSDIQENIAIQKEYDKIMREKAKEQEEKELKRRQEYESWKSNPNNGYKISKRIAERKRKRQKELERYEKASYQVGDRIIIVDTEKVVMYDGEPILDRKGTDIVREVRDDGLIVGDQGVYSRDEIRKPFSNSEYSGLTMLQLEGKLK